VNQQGVRTPICATKYCVPLDSEGSAADADRQTQVYPSLAVLAASAGPKADLSLTAGTEALRAVQAIAAEYNRISSTLSDQPRSYAPRFGRTADGHPDPTPWCDGFGRVIRPRRRLWKRLLDTSRAEFRMIDPILAHASPATARALLGPKAVNLSLPEGNPAPTIAAAVVTLRGYWMPDRAKASRNASR
jgi:hypothetical protein